MCVCVAVRRERPTNNVLTTRHVPCLFVLEVGTLRQLGSDVEVDGPTGK